MVYIIYIILFYNQQWSPEMNGFVHVHDNCTSNSALKKNMSNQCDLHVSKQTDDRSDQTRCLPLGCDSNNKPVISDIMSIPYKVRDKQTNCRHP